MSDRLMSKENYQIVSKHKAKLTEDDLGHLERIAFDYLKTHDFVTNRIMRNIANISYDQAIFFFGQALKRKALKKIGAGSATRYLLSAGAASLST
jgi:hypothetical protein